jgi:hypothetical protein
LNLLRAINKKKGSKDSMRKVERSESISEDVYNVFVDGMFTVLDQPMKTAKRKFNKNEENRE